MFTKDTMTLLDPHYTEQFSETLNQNDKRRPGTGSGVFTVNSRTPQRQVGP